MLEYQVTASRAPILRAGWTNVALPGGVIVPYVCWDATRAATGSQLWAWLCAVIVGTFVAWQYSRTLTGIRVDEREIVLTFPLGKRPLALGDVEHVVLRHSGRATTASLQINLRTGGHAGGQIRYPLGGGGDLAHWLVRFVGALGAAGITVREVGKGGATEAPNS